MGYLDLDLGRLDLGPGLDLGLGLGPCLGLGVGLGPDLCQGIGIGLGQGRGRNERYDDGGRERQWPVADQDRSMVSVAVEIYD